MNTTTRASLLALPALGLLLGGCQVNRDVYDELRNGYAALKARNVELTDENSALRQSLDDLRRSQASGSSAAEEAMSLNARLRADNQALISRLQELENRLQGLSMQPVQIALDTQTDAALKALADQFPGVLSFDSARGMLRFTSDVTFSSGSFELTEAGRRAVREFGRVLKGTPSAEQYEIAVVGHTDTQPVTLRDARRFRDNAELSAFRAISVRNELVSAGMDAHNIEFAGFGETRPAVPNSRTGNTPQNRRVEVYLFKKSYTGLTAEPVASRQAPAPAPGTPRPAGPATPGAAPAGGAAPAPSPTGGSDIEVLK
jgi:flagellar motor protein MotB